MSNELDLAIALKAALRWLYRDTADHVRGSVPVASGFADQYKDDVDMIRRGVRVAQSIGIPIE